MRLQRVLSLVDWERSGWSTVVTGRLRAEHYCHWGTESREYFVTGGLRVESTVTGELRTESTVTGGLRAERVL